MMKIQNMRGRAPGPASGRRGPAEMERAEVRVRMISAVCAACVLAAASGGCSMLPSAELDSGVMSAASRAESAAADAASALARVQSAASAINRAASSETSDGGTKDATDATVNMKMITGGDGRYSISVPDSWQDLKGRLGGDSEGFLIETGSFDEQTFLIFGAEPSEDSNLTSFDDYFATLTQGVTGSSSLSDVKTSNPETITLKTSGLQGKKVTFTADYHPQGASDQRIAYRIYGAEGSGIYYQFCCWTTAANSAMMDETLDRIVSSFTVSS